MKKVIRYIQGPTFTATQWSTVNPLLIKGEIGYLLSDDGEVIAAKVGPGNWNDLGFLGDDIYSFAEAVTNPIGDAKGVLEGQKLKDVVHKMLNPYQPPVFSQVVNNAGGSYLNIVTREIGQQVNSPVGLEYLLSNTDKLVGGTPIQVNTGGVFTNEGNFPLVHPIILSRGTPINPITPTEVVIQIRATHQQGVTPYSTTRIKWDPKIMWISTPLSNIPDSGTFMSVVNRQSLVSNVYTRDYSFYGNGYSYLAVPAMSNPLVLKFTDVTDPVQPANYQMDQVGTLSINNGVATYNYVLYKSTFNLINPTILRVTQP